MVVATGAALALEDTMLRSLALTALAAAISIPLTAQANPRVLVGHFAPFSDDLAATAVDISVNGETVLNAVEYGDFTDYIDLPAAGEYMLAVTPVGATEPAIQATVNLAADTDYTVLAVGNGGLQDLALLPLVDDNALPAMGNVKVRIVHAAPFAADLEATEVSIRTDGGDVVGELVGVPFGGASGYLELPAANYDLKVASNDGSTNLIDLAPVDLPAGAVLTVLAVGDGTNQPLGFYALPLGQLPTEPVVDLSVNGHWSVVGARGQGFAFTPLLRANRFLASWYGYLNDEQVWFTIDSCKFDAATLEGCPGVGTFNNREASAAIYAVTGGVLFGDVQPTYERVGDFDITFQSCTNATASLNVGEANFDIELVNLVPSGVCTIPTAE